MTPDLEARVASRALEAAEGEPNPLLPTARAKRASLTRSAARSQRWRRAGVGTAAFGLVSGLLLGAATLLGAPLAGAALGAAALVPVGGIVSAMSGRRRHRVERQLDILSTTHLGRCLEVEEQLASLVSLRHRLAARFQAYERSVVQAIDSNDHAANADVLAEGRRRHLAAVARLDALEERGRELLRRLEQASVQERTKRRLAAVAPAANAYIGDADTVDFAAEPAAQELDQLRFELESLQELEAQFPLR